MNEEEDTIVFTLSEFGRMQNEMLKLKHENAKLKKLTDQIQELTKLHPEPLEYVESLKEQVAALSQELQRTGSSRTNLSLNKEKFIEKAKQIKADLSQDTLDLLTELASTFEEAKTTEPSKQEQDHVAEISKLKAELRKAALTSESYIEKCKALEIALDSTSNDSSEMSKQIEELESQKENMIYLLASREEEINDARAQIKDKYSVECEKFELQKENEKLQAKFKKLEEEISSLRGEGAQTIKERLAETEKANEEMKSELQQFRAQAKAATSELSELRLKSSEVQGEFEKTKAELTRANEELQAFHIRVKSLQTELDDARTEKQIIQKRSMHDLKDLKQELAKEKTSHSESKIEVERMRNEIRQLQTIQRSAVRGKLDAAGQSEKVFVEELANRCNELENELWNCKSKADAAERLEAELEEQMKLNDELVEEIAKLQIDLATYGAQVNDLIRKGALK
mmetsp:Transcript_6477/g.11326  ORF Transcript_6477/g.11326 Transcript_6477/m.11326 type:complete len:457 (-) Transcript_6477:2423-3793(-)